MPSRNLILLLHKPGLISGEEGLLKFTFLADLESARFFRTLFIQDECLPTTALR
ncbi:hypothetical protein [Endozoicomonas sp. GU-1]|uniref:hypothetical protein n=1 Tax=Endozoicomonas sp. GU-1 TaxID=3009078 RepID=UPI0022B2D91C|nr:hypothetical protein [Endozoicomonas sp. GU-1]WBA81689.1 hypothetical protein O2T12_00465 [Endozoicomonas sp. GU-1]